MKFVSGINKPSQNLPNHDNDFKQRTITVPNEQQTHSIPISIPTEEYNKFREEISKSVQADEISEKDKSYLQALLGFGVADKKIDLYFKNIKYTITIQHFSEKINEQFSIDLVDLESAFKSDYDNAESKSEKDKISSNFLFAKRRLWISHSVKEVEIGPPVNKIFTKQQIISALNLDNFEQLLETWGQEACEQLFATYNELNQELKNTLLNPSKLIDDLKK